jgi:hypothetical protein
MSIWFREVTCIRLQYRLLLKGHVSVQNRRWMNGCKPFPVMGSVEFLWITMNLSVQTWFILFCQYWLMLNRMMFANLCQHPKVCWLLVDYHDFIMWWSFHVSKCPVLCRGKVLLGNVLSRYIRNFLLVRYGKLLTFVDVSLQGHFCASSCSNKWKLWFQEGSDPLSFLLSFKKPLLWTNKSSDLVVCAHEKIGSLIKRSNNDLFIGLKVNYSIGP